MTFALDSRPGRIDAGLDTQIRDRQLIRIVAGIALSLLAHALLLAIHHQPASLAPPAAAPQALTLHLRPIAPPAPVIESAPVIAPAPATVPATSAAPRAQRPPRPTRTPPPPSVIALEPAQRPASDDSFVVPPAPVDAAPPAPRFDLGAARAMARKLADEPDPARAGTPLERLPRPELQTESKLERGIKGAKRANCKDGVPGGLLAPLFLMMDKKDSGCKW